MKKTNEFSGAIRAAQAEDLPHIMDIERECFAATEAYEAADMDEYLQKSLTNSQTPLVLAFAKASKGKTIVGGYGLGDMEQKTRGVIVSIAVKKDFRGQRVGRKLLDTVCESLRKAGATRIILQVESNNKAAIHLYETAGFVKERILKNYYGPKRNADLMARKF